MNINVKRAVFAGVVGTAVMTMIGLWMAPMMGMPVFSGSASLAMGSLVGHLIYGAVVGALYGPLGAEAKSGARTATATS